MIDKIVEKDRGAFVQAFVPIGPKQSVTYKFKEKEVVERGARIIVDHNNLTSEIEKMKDLVGSELVVGRGIRVREEPSIDPSSDYQVTIRLQPHQPRCSRTPFLSQTLRSITRVSSSDD